MSAESCLFCNPYLAISNYPYVRNTFKKGLLDDLMIYILFWGGEGRRDHWDVNLEASAVLSCPFGFMCARNVSERLHADVLTTMVPTHSLSIGNCPSMRSVAEV